MPDAVDYPVNLTVDYPDRALNKVSTFFRVILIIPIGIILALLWNGRASIMGLVVLPTILMLLFRHKYPKWWFDWNYALTRFCYQVMAYLFVMDDRYPSTDEEQSVHVQLPYPQVQTELHPGLPLIKWLLAFPHYVVLVILGIYGLILVMIAWFAVLFTGRYPKGMFDFIEGLMRWELRVMAYAILMTTDKYPPFSLK